MTVDIGWLSLLPPIIAIILVLLTKESVFSLMIGGVVGCLVCSNFNPIKAIEMLFQVMTVRMAENIYIILFLALLGSLVVIMTNSGGAMAYGDWISKRIKTKTGSQLAAVVLGLIIFIDDYFNCLTIGATMGPIFDRYKISREKLAYLIDSTAAPICIIVPISSWVAIILSTLDGTGVKNSFEVFVKSIPYNFYAIFTIVMVLGVILLKVDFGPMKKFEDLAKNEDGNKDLKCDKDLKINPNGKGRDLIVPIIVLIIFSILSLLYDGGYFCKNITVLDALKLANSQKSLTYGAVVALIVSFFMVVPTKRLSFKNYMGSITDGVKSMVPAYMILTLAWTVGGVCQKVGTGEYVKYIVQTLNIPIWILPVAIFAISGFLAFSTGTAWGTFGILIPVVGGMANGMGENILVLFIAATLAGSTYGSHSSPISDTCILSATGANCKHIHHVMSQIPYTDVVAGICCLSYIIISFFNSIFVAYVVGILCILAIPYFLSKWCTYKKG